MLRAGGLCWGVQQVLQLRVPPRAAPLERRASRRRAMEVLQRGAPRNGGPAALCVGGPTRGPAVGSCNGVRSVAR